MTTVPDSGPETDAVLALLRTVHPRVGDAQAPRDQTLPYAVLYPAGLRLYGPLGDGNADMESLQQVTTVGASRKQAQALADLLRTALLSTPLTVAGRGAVHVWLETSQPVRRDDSVTPPLFYAVDQLRFLSSPATP